MTPDILNYLEHELHVSNLKLRGRGAFGEVYAGERKGWEYAFKISLDPLNEKLHNMAEKELAFMTGQAIKDCPHIVRLHDWDWKNRHLIMWFDLGEHSLADRLQKCADEGRAGLPPEELCRYLRDAAKAIDVVNDLGFLHRDIKPDNLLVFRDGGVRVADFGLVQFVGASTMSKSTAGTIEYIAPEALEAEEGQRGKLTRTADIYSLAATAIKLAKGHGPFGETLIKILDAKRAGRAVTKDLTPSQTAAVLAALHPDPARRHFKTATDFVKAFLNESVVGQPPRSSSPQAPAKEHRRQSQSWWSRMKSWWSRLWSPSSPQAPAKEHRKAGESEIQVQARPTPVKVAKNKANVGKLDRFDAVAFLAASGDSSPVLRTLIQSSVGRLTSEGANTPTARKVGSARYNNHELIRQASSLNNPSELQRIGKLVAQRLLATPSYSGISFKEALSNAKSLASEFE